VWRRPTSLLYGWSINVNQLHPNVPSPIGVVQHPQVPISFFTRQGQVSNMINHILLTRLGGVHPKKGDPEILWAHELTRRDECFKCGGKGHYAVVCPTNDKKFTLV
jgi:hypothetical protein